MPEVTKLQDADLVILSTEIGRGHPSYLDGIVEILDTTKSDVSFLKIDVFTVSQDISLAAWKLVRRLYKWGSQGGIITSLYGLLRRVSGSVEGGGILHRILGIGLKKYLLGFKGPVVVAHPIVARILSDQNRVIYQHGELAAPGEAIIRGCRKILVPLKDTARTFGRSGIPEEMLIVTGQCIETSLVTPALPAFQNRIEHLQGSKPLTAALFSSGAYPKDHLRKLRLAAVSLYRAGLTVILFPGRSEKVANGFLRYFRQMNIDVAADLTGSAQVKLVRSSGRLDDNQKVASIFEKLDFFVAPAHERTNWAVGLGLPQFILSPHIGSYAPLNAEIALEQGAAQIIDSEADAANLGEVINSLRAEGKLVEMAQKGFGNTQIDGFSNCVKTILKELEGIE